MEDKTKSNIKKRTWERRVDEAKKKHRPKLLNWSRDGFCFHRKDDFERFRREQPRTREIKMEEVRTINWPGEYKAQLEAGKQLVPRLSCDIISVEQFIDKLEIPDIPCVLSNIPRSEGWSAVKNWTFEKLKQYKPFMFKVGEDDKGYKVKIRMKYLLQYLHNNVDDSPLYCFDSGYDGNSNTKSILNDYKPPSYFPFDLFSLVGEKRRPPYRWFLIGPKRSGTTLHIDPLGTSAWNTSIAGRKRWVLFPPGTSKSVAKGLDVIKKGEDDEAINYFVDLLPRIRAKHPDITMLEFIQNEGDTVFVPGGWWHAVINIDDTIAITQVRFIVVRQFSCGVSMLCLLEQNYCSPANFDNVWRKTRKGRPKMSVKWLRELRATCPLLAQRADELNQDDGFVMYDKKKRERDPEPDRAENDKQKEKEKDNDKDSTEKKIKKHKSSSSSSLETASVASAATSMESASVSSDNHTADGETLSTDGFEGKAKRKFDGESVHHHQKCNSNKKKSKLCI